MSIHGYSESDLVANRASLLLRGGGERDRRAWAEEAHRSFEGEGPLRTVTAGAELAAALAPSRGVVFVPDVLTLSEAEQGQIIRCLQEREERPKIILGLSVDPQAAVAHGKLRSDLHYRLQQAQVDLSSGELKEAIRARRAIAEAALAKLQKEQKEQAAAAKTQKARPASRPAVTVPAKTTGRVSGAKAAPKKAAARSLSEAKPKKKPVAARRPVRRPVKAAAKVKAKPSRSAKKR